MSGPPDSGTAQVGAEQVSAIESAYEALNRGDVAGTLAPLDENAEWHESAELPDADVIHGRAAIEQFLARFLESWEELTQTVEGAEVEGDRVCLFLHLEARGRGSGADVDAHYAHVWTVHDGRGVRVDAFYDRDAALRALREPDG